MNQKFSIWNGVFYFEVQTEVVKGILTEIGQRAGIPKRIYQDAEFNNKFYEQLVLHATIQKEQGRLGVVFVNFLNETLIIERGKYKMTPRHPDNILTYVLPLCYDPDAESLMFSAFLSRILPDKASQMVLAEHFAYAFVPHSLHKLEKVAVLYGNGANGKSVIHDIIAKIFPPESLTHYSLEGICDTKGYDRAELANKLLNYCSEMSTKMNIEVFKKLVSGEPVSCRSPYGKPQIIYDYAKLIFNCNELPWTVEHNLAFFRRLHIFLFDVTIPEEEQDKKLANKIVINELPSVFNWILGGLERLIEQRKFTACEALQNQVEQYRDESDTVVTFLPEVIKLYFLLYVEQLQSLRKKYIF